MIGISLHTGSVADTIQWRSSGGLEGSFASTGTTTAKRVALAQSLLAAGVSQDRKVLWTGNGENSLADIIVQHPSISVAAMAAL